MAKYRVTYETTASYEIEVEIDDFGLDEQDAREVARQKADEEHAEKAPSEMLCHYCSSTYELGEFEQDVSDSGVRKVAD